MMLGEKKENNELDKVIIKAVQWVSNKVDYYVRFS